jgi:prepilin-type processing-associated H-X9-DG protein
MNSRLQRRSEDGAKPTGNYASIIRPDRTVVFLERGMPGDKQVSKIQGGFDAAAKANPKNFAARHNQKGILVFADGHTEVHSFSDLVDKSGRIPMPQENIIWTADPEANPN